MNLPNCYYCGKFLNPNKDDIGSKELWDYDGLNDVVFYHKSCKEPGDKRRQELLNKINQRVNK